jgi:hypothetical protein
VETRNKHRDAVVLDLVNHRTLDQGRAREVFEEVQLGTSLLRALRRAVALVR